MTLRKKTLLIIGISLIGLLALSGLISQTILLNSFLDLEKQDAYQNTERARTALFSELKGLDRIAGDWAPWDDTYAFVAQPTESYIEQNLMDSTFTNFDLNLMLFGNLADQIVFAKAFDLKTQTEIAVPQSLKDHLAQNPALLHHSNLDSSTTGLINLPETTLLLASRPVLTSQYHGPIRGAVVMGRFLDDTLIETLAASTQLSLSVYRVDAPRLPADVQAARTALSKDTPIFVQPLSEETIAGYTVLEDIYNQPALWLKVELPRQIYRQGQASLASFMVIFLAGGIFLNLLVVLLLEKGLLSRLAYLHQSVGRIATFGDLTNRVLISGKDELSALAARINDMLAALQQSQTALSQARQDLEIRVEERTAELQQANTLLQQEIGERTQIEKALQESNNQLATIYEIGQLITAQLQLDALLNSLARSTADLLGADTGVILLIDEASQTLSIKAAYGLSEYLIKNTRDRLGESIAGRVAVTGQPLIVNDLLHDPIFYNPAATQEGLLACVSVPLRTGHQIIGTLDIHSKTNSHAFDEGHVHLLQMLANQAAIAIHNARLYSAAQQEIAERKQMQEILAIARDQALEANRFKTELLAKVSHELRTPLGAILGYTEMLTAQVYGPLPDYQQKPVNEIIDSTKYLIKLVNELLSQAQLETGQFKLYPKLFNPTDLANKVQANMYPLAQAKGLTLTTQVSPTLPSPLNGDPVRIQQILVNLVSNALKFTQTGTIQVHLYRSGPNYWALQVADTGIGIPVEAQVYIFDPFRQVDGSATREHSGTGLGLSIVKQLVALMGGEIRLESEVGQGSTFTVLLPLEPALDKTTQL